MVLFYYDGVLRRDSVYIGDKRRVVLIEDDVIFNLSEGQTYY